MTNKEKNIHQIYTLAKAEHTAAVLLLFHVKQYFESFYTDAETIAALTRLPVNPIGEIPVVRFPENMLQKYLNLLLDAGHSVCISEVRNTGGKFILSSLCQS